LKGLCPPPEICPRGRSSAVPEVSLLVCLFHLAVAVGKKNITMCLVMSLNPDTLQSNAQLQLSTALSTNLDIFFICIPDFKTK
jgi:hypothetical protein